MVLTNRLVGGILLVSGTSIGAGMLALPVISSFAGFFPSFGLLAICWFLLFITSLLLLDVNLACRGEVNMISMAGRTLGAWGKGVCWVTYLLLLYSLIAAYIAGGAPLFLQGLAHLTGWSAPSWVGPFPLLFLFGIFVYLGTHAVDWINRLLMFGLIFSYILLIIFLPSQVQLSLLQHIDIQAVAIAVPVVMTSFGFHIIIPTLTTYLDHDVKKLRLTLFIGSLIPLVVYTIWEYLILGIVPLWGEEGLMKAWVSGESGATALSNVLQKPWITTVASAFSFFAIITSFLGVSLSLSDFLTDGLKMKRFSLGREFACLLTFIPPLIFALSYQRGFILALEYGGGFVAILLCILPALMAWKLPHYRSLPRRLLLAGVILVSLFVIGLVILNEAGLLDNLTRHYVST
ncbi:MAG TPA: aromatic amino acid transport family protein [Chlamydiales bacterium]|nr:aromatic amino acid transport family protein [Chlamydiales bacterium]